MTRRPASITAIALVALAAALAAWALARQDPNAGAVPTARSAKAAGVGTVTTLTAGTLRATPAAGGRRATLRKGSTLRLGDLVTIGPRTKATLTLTRPTSVPSDAELVFLRSSDGTARDVTVKTTGARTTRITIG